MSDDDLAMSELDDLSDDDLAQGFLSDERFRAWFTALDFPEPGEDSIMPMLFVAEVGDPPPA